METLNNNTIVTGSANSGKSKLIRDYLTEINSDFVIAIDDKKNFENFHFAAQKHTQIVLVNDILNVERLNFYASLTVTGIVVNKPNTEPFRINPKFILECSKEQFEPGFFDFKTTSFIHRKFEIIDVDVISTLK